MQQNLLLRDHPRAVRAPLPATLQDACHVYLDGKQSAGKHEVDADQHFLKESIMNKRDRLESGLQCNSYPTHIEESFHRSQEEWKKLKSLAKKCCLYLKASMPKHARVLYLSSVSTTPLGSQPNRLQFLFMLLLLPWHRHRHPAIRRLLLQLLHFAAVLVNFSPSGRRLLISMH